jgi:hypothetical protein
MPVNKRVLIELMFLGMTAAGLVGCNHQQGAPLEQSSQKSEPLDPSQYGIAERATQVERTHREVQSEIAELRKLIYESDFSSRDTADLRLIVDQSIKTDRMYINTYEQLKHDQQNLTPLTLMFITGDTSPQARVGATLEILQLARQPDEPMTQRLLRTYLPGRLKSDRNAIDSVTSLFHGIDMRQLTEPQKQFLEHEMASVEASRTLLELVPELLQSRNTLGASDKLVIAELLVGRAEWEVRMFEFAKTPEERALILAGATTD